MRHYYRFWLIIFLLFIGFSQNGVAQIKIGVGGGLVTDNSLALLQGRLEIGPRSFHLATSFNFVLDDGLDWAIDFDGHYNVLDISEDVYIDVFPGINLLKAPDDTDIGLNLGAAIKINTNKNIIYIEPKYTVGTYDSFALTAGFIF